MKSSMMKGYRHIVAYLGSNQVPAIRMALGCVCLLHANAALAAERAEAPAPFCDA